MSSNSGNQQSRRTTSVQQALAEDKAEIVRKFHSKAMPVIDENDAGYPKQSRANIGISQLSIPLVWNSELHFKSKGDSRTYSMFAVLQTKTKVVDSRMITNIDRTVTDVVFPESYVFESEPDDFCIEVSLFAARTDQGLVDSSGSLRSKITRSLGRKFGTNVKTQLATLEFNKMRGDSILGGTHFNLLARAYLVLPDAGEDCKIHDLKMSAFADLSGPPLYGHIMCRMAVQPLSVLHPLVEGMLTVKPLGENTALKNVQSRLQAGNLTCYMNVDVHKCPSREEVLMQIPITSGSKIVSTAYPYTFLLATEGTTDAEGSELFVTADNEKSKDTWKRALEAQITDCEIWGNFAYTPTKLTHEKRKDPVKETLSRASGNTLYDKISITGTISKGTAPSLSPSFSYCPRNLSPLQTDISKTAPSRRNKQRTNVLDIFPNPAPSESPKNSIQENDSWGYTKESSAVYTPMSTRMRDPMAMDYSSLSRYDTYSNTSSPYLSGKKSWSRSIGEFIGKKINTPSVQVTSPKVNSTMRLLLLLGLCGLAFSFSCKDQDGKDVDWWAVYKMPIEQDNSVPGINQGVAWYYVDVNKKGALLPSQETLNSKKQAIAYTLQQYYDVQNDPTIFHVMYNDEPYVAPTASESWFDKISNFFVTSNSASVQKGHTKGVSFFNKTNGVWYVHSVPLFPPPDHYEYPDSGHIYGQTMLCMSFKYSELAKIGTQLYYNNPQIYSSRLPSNMAQDNPDLAKIIGNQHKSGAPQSSIVDLTTVGGSTFKSFAKTNEFNNDLYDGLIAPMLKTNLYAETWRRGSVIPVNCQQPYFTLDAQNMKIGNTAEFSYTKDHTKMARSVDATKPYVCIGDINRMQSQYSRGGGSECISSTFLWNAFNVFVDTNSCPAPGKDFLRGNRVPIN